MFRYSSLPFQQVQINDPFWNERLRVNHEQSLPKQYEMCERTGRFDALKLEWKRGCPTAASLLGLGYGEMAGGGVLRLRDPA